jgi:hypothetical protein
VAGWVVRVALQRSPNLKWREKGFISEEGGDRWRGELWGELELEVEVGFCDEGVVATEAVVGEFSGVGLVVEVLAEEFQRLVDLLCVDVREEHFVLLLALRVRTLPRRVAVHLDLIKPI